MITCSSLFQLSMSYSTTEKFRVLTQVQIPVDRHLSKRNYLINLKIEKRGRLVGDFAKSWAS